ncbi:MAG TPA: hypothetical protein VMN81_05375 [Vicinamibacterales bacterium]|nr:hypothetical protein [Vicinamibacterales bacterium]
MTIYRYTPQEAWVKHVKPALNIAAWIEDSSAVGTDIDLSKREVLSLLLIAHVRRDQTQANCRIGYDTEGVEPNDGFVEGKDGAIHVESKLVAQYDERPLLDAIRETYDKYEGRGPAYGSGRELMVFANRASDRPGLTRVSSLRDHILTRKESPFDRVLLAYCRPHGPPGTISIGVVEAFPGKGFAHVNIDVTSGEAGLRLVIPFSAPVSQSSPADADKRRGSTSSIGGKH